MVERGFNQDRSDHVGPRRPCRCGSEARYAGRHPKTFETVLGPLTLERAYYYWRGQANRRLYDRLGGGAETAAT